MVGAGAAAFALSRSAMYAIARIRSWKIGRSWQPTLTSCGSPTGPTYQVNSFKVGGWAFRKRMTSGLYILALNMALMTRYPQLVIPYSDYGSR